MTETNGLRTLYVNRPLLNSAELIKWAKDEGFSKTLAADDLHVTIAYSKRPVDWERATPRDNTVTVTEGDRAVEALGATGDAIVLRFSSDRLAKRHQQFRDIGASWDWPEYKPHLTIAYKGEGEDIDISSIQPFDGDLVFGPEEFAELDEDWKSKAVSAMDGLKVMIQDRIALDRAASARTVGADGHMKVTGSAVSKANVCEYLAEEIPGAESLGLTPGKRYRLYRDAKSLAASADSLNGKPLMTIHKPQSAADHDHEVVVGSLHNARWDAPYLRADLTVWDQEAIDLIDSGEQRELSCAYRYVPVMQAGVSPEGEPYDGVMTQISMNHTALVAKGRAGPSVSVMDNDPFHSEKGRTGPGSIGVVKPSHKEISMAKSVLSRKAAMIQGALVASVVPKLAQDAKVDFDKVLKGVTAQNYKAKKTGIAKAFEGKLAADADIDDVIELLDQLESIEPSEVVEAATDPITVDPADKDKPVEDDDNTALLEYLKGVLSDEEYQKVCAMVGGDAPAMDDKEPKPEVVTKTAMDAAIASAVKAASTAATANAIKTQSAIRDAERFVRPWIGDLAMSFDSAEGVYRHTLKALEVNCDGVHADALKPILEAQPIPGAAVKRTPIAQDAAADKSYAERFPNANRLK